MENGRPKPSLNVSPKRMRGDDIAERLLKLAARVIRVAGSLPRTPPGRHIADQIVRSGTAPGALYEEARGAQSKRDFVHKLSIVLKELQETRYWLRLTECSEMISKTRLASVAAEVDELCRIVGASLKTVKSNSNRDIT